jgi:hypothetical protein
MPVADVRRYYFGLRRSGHEDDDANGTLLSDDAAALNYADRLIRQLKDAGGYSDPNLMMIVRDGMKKVVQAAWRHVGRASREDARCNRCSA